MKSLVINKRFTIRDTSSFNQYLREIREIDMLTPKEEKELTIRSSDGDEEAIEMLIKANLRFVVSVAKQYVYGEVPLQDLINEGNIGLIVAAKNFKPDMGLKFITYAVWWIRKHILEYLNKNSRMVRIPSNKLYTLNKLEKNISSLEQSLDRNIDLNDLLTNDLFESFDDDEEGVKALNNTILGLKEEFDLLTMLSNNVTSMDMKISDSDDEVSIGDLMSNEECFKSSDYDLIQQDRKDLIMKYLNCLKPREKQVIIWVFGLDGDFPKSLKDIGDELNITREMVRQIRNTSIDKLKEKMSNTDLFE